jgi:hypothetical protein
MNCALVFDAAALQWLLLVLTSWLERANIPRVSATWPPSGARKRPPTLEHVRDLRTLHYVQSTCTAAIWRNDFGLELRVEHGGELIASRLSRFGEAPLLLIADQLKANLIAQGWTEAPNAT